MDNNLYRWVLASQQLPTMQDYYNTFGIIYRAKSMYPSIKQTRANFSVETIKASDAFYMWLEKINPPQEVKDDETPEQKAKFIADQCKPCTDDFYNGIYQGVLLTIKAQLK